MRCSRVGDVACWRERRGGGVRVLLVGLGVGGCLGRPRCVPCVSVSHSRRTPVRPALPPQRCPTALTRSARRAGRVRASREADTGHQPGALLLLTRVGARVVCVVPPRKCCCRTVCGTPLLVSQPRVRACVMAQSARVSRVETDVVARVCGDRCMCAGGGTRADAGVLMGSAEERRAVYDRERARALESMAARRGGGASGRPRAAGRRRRRRPAEAFV